MASMEIYFDDLNEEAQKEVLKLYELENAKDGNFEISPLAILEYEPEEKSEED